MKLKTKIIAAHLILLLVIMAYSKYTQADIVLNLHIGSVHTGTNGYYSAETGELTDYNESNPGVGLSLQFNNNTEMRGGYFVNSHDADSFYIGGAMYTSSRRLIGAGIVGGVVTGYHNTVQQADFKPIQPFVMPAIFINYGRVRTEIGYIPAITEGMATAVTFTTGIRF